MPITQFDVLLAAKIIKANLYTCSLAIVYDSGKLYTRNFSPAYHQTENL